MPHLKHEMRDYRSILLIYVKNFPHINIKITNTIRLDSAFLSMSFILEPYIFVTLFASMA